MTAAEYLDDQLSKRSMYKSCIDDITEVVSEIMEDYTQSRIAELEAERDKLREALEASLDAMKWMFENMSVDDKSLQSDSFNIPTNAIVLAEQTIGDEMLPPGSAPIYTHSLEYMEKYKQALNSKEVENDSH